MMKDLGIVAMHKTPQCPITNNKQKRCKKKKVLKTILKKNTYIHQISKESKQDKKEKVGASR